MYCKITNEKENHNGFKYKTGLNTDTVPWNPSGTCESGGLYFCDIKNILGFLNYGVWLREVTLPEGEEVYKDPEGNKHKAHQIILGKRRDLRKISTWKFLIKNGADVHAENDYALRWASERGHLEVVKVLVENGADVHADDDYALRWASERGHLEVVKYLIEHGANPHASNDFALYWASENGHLEVVEYLKSVR